MPTRLRSADCSGPWIRRRRLGRRFSYVDERGDRIDDPAVLERIAALAIPPAWEDVWICPYPNGHLQATAPLPPGGGSAALLGDEEPGEPDEQDPEIEGVEEVEAGAGAQSLPGSGSGDGGSGSCGSGASGPSGVSGATGPGTGSAGTVGVSGTTGPTGSDGPGTSSVRGMRSGYPRVWRWEPWID